MKPTSLTTVPTALGASALDAGLSLTVTLSSLTPLVATSLKVVSTQPQPKHLNLQAAEKEVNERYDQMLGIQGNRTVDDFHKTLGKLMWDHVGMGRNKAGLEKVLQEIPALRDEFWQNVKVSGSKAELNQTLEKAGRVADFLEFGEMMAYDALDREESCGGHFREEHQSAEGEAKRDDENYCHVSAWEFQGVGNKHAFHKEPLNFDNVKLVTRSYK